MAAVEMNLTSVHFSHRRCMMQADAIADALADPSADALAYASADATECPPT